MGFLSSFSPCYQGRESKVDLNNPPPHVIKAAADFGVPVHVFKELYLDRPDICESATDLYKYCMSVSKHRKEDTRVCETLMETRKYRQCDKFEKKYRKTIRDESW